MSERYGFSLNLQSFGKISPNRICLECGWRRRTVRWHQSNQWRRVGHREEAKDHTPRRPQHQQDRVGRKECWHGLLWHGTGLQTDRQIRTQAHPTVCHDVRRRNTNCSNGPTCCRRYAGVHTIRVCLSLYHSLPTRHSSQIMNAILVF